MDISTARVILHQRLLSLHAVYYKGSMQFCVSIRVFKFNNFYCNVY